MRSVADQSWGDTRTALVGPGIIPDTQAFGELVRVSLDYPRVFVVSAEADGIDRLAGDVGQLALEVTIGAGRSAREFLLLSPLFVGSPTGPTFFAAQSVSIVGKCSGVTLAGPRTLRWSAYLAPWSWTGPETMARDGWPLLQERPQDGSKWPR